MATNAGFCDVAPDDQRFLIVRPHAGDTDAPTEVILVENFVEELKRLVPR